MSLEEMTAIAVTSRSRAGWRAFGRCGGSQSTAYAAKKPRGRRTPYRGASANFIENPDLEPPFMCLIVSGGHTHLVIVKDYGGI